LIEINLVKDFPTPKTHVAIEIGIAGDVIVKRSQLA